MKEEISNLAQKYQVPVTFVASYAHMKNERENGSWIFVDEEKESVDIKIVNFAKRYDVVVTQDIGLASMLVENDICVITPKGKIITSENIEPALFLRYMNAKERQKKTYINKPKKFSDKDRVNFIKAFEKKCRILQENNKTYRN
ncbi:DUF188 domain-containing protein [Bacillus carboniphilus]|uniref:DUF188 domain-containing protein n=1 Tax=Bacillus carboniphilus TaxID=86663 RepID=A0ABY9JX86_9BACI|nr:DUF188 domain-containing protein [Bacillus carboniphilus]WLR43975.1 DUF188 domain-containing protein [Bacillus carboniphilus]